MTGFHDVPGTPHEFVQLLDIGFHILDRLRCDAVHRGFRNGRRDFADKARVEGFRNHIIRAEANLVGIRLGNDIGAFGLREICDRLIVAIFISSLIVVAPTSSAPGK